MIATPVHGTKLTNKRIIKGTILAMIVRGDNKEDLISAQLWVSHQVSQKVYDVCIYELLDGGALTCTPHTYEDNKTVPMYYLSAKRTGN